MAERASKTARFKTGQRFQLCRSCKSFAIDCGQDRTLESWSVWHYQFCSQWGLPLNGTVPSRGKGSQRLQSPEELDLGFPVPIWSQIPSLLTAVTISFDECRLRSRQRRNHKFPKPALRLESHPAHGGPWTDCWTWTSHSKVTCRSKLLWFVFATWLLLSCLALSKSIQMA